MIIEDEDALICDFAETYSIYDYRSLPVELAATLACGLRENSRIMMKLRGEKVSSDMAMQAMHLDALNMLVWMQTKDAAKGRNRPKSVYKAMTEEHKEKVVAFESGEELMKELRRIREGT